MAERGIDFLDAVLIWEDPFRQERIDTRGDYGEIRYQTIGKCHLGIFFVAYTVRVYVEGQLVNRLISVRRAKRKEILHYESRTFSKAVGL